MSRSGYREDLGDQWQLIRWRGAVASALKGRKGQAFLREMLAAFDALPNKSLISGEMIREGEVCAIGAVGIARGLAELNEIDPEDHETVAAEFNIAHAMACEIMFENDEGGHHKETPNARYLRMRRWIERQLSSPTGADAP